jgi:tetratricopeptide (TPR) repeat protein
MTTMTTIELSVVRIRAPEGRTVGAGFLVADRQVLTCAHVIAAALSLPEDTPETLRAEVHLDFPLVAPARILTARVIHWQPESDVAGLQLDGDPPTDARPVRLVTAKDLWAHAFRAFGFPAGYDDGVWASGLLRGRQAAGWVQIEDVKEPGYRVQPGFSGTAVWDEQLNGVVGMAVAADTAREIKAAFMIPANLLIQAWPQLAQRSLEAGSLEYLHFQLAGLEAAQQNAPDPRRFQSRIDELQAAIAHWDGRVEQQRQRIADGLEAQRQQVAVQRRDEMRLRVVGRRPLDVTDYFKDRERELATIGRLLAEPTTRLVSIIGHGGMGKTAVACKVLRDLERHRWPRTDGEVPLDGIVYLSTRTAGISLERLFLDCAKVLGSKQEKRLNAIWTNPQLGTEDKVARLLEALSEGRYVILLDNIEDLLDDEGKLVDEDLRLFFEHSLTTSQGARLLVTSRVALAFRREVLEGLPIADGVALLRELDPNGGYGLRDASEKQLAQAVSLVHGVPRALEVLAGILANDPFASLDDVLEQFYEREDVVEALIEENYKRLDGNARRVIEALAVFRRPVPPLALDYLLEPFAPGLDVPDIIRRLTRTNIVNVDRAAKTVTLHPIDQDYAYSQLPEEGTGEPAYTRRALERRAADYYVQLRTPPETWKTIDDLAPQLAEFEHRVRAGDYDNACQVLDPIDFDYLSKWGHYIRLVEMREKLLERLTDPGLQAANLGSLGRVYRALGQAERAIEFHEQALTITRQIGDRAGGQRLGNLGRAYHDLGQFVQAIRLYEEALVIASEIGDRQEEGDQLNRLGLAYRALGWVERAIEFYEEALAIARETGDCRREGRYLGNLGDAYGDLGWLERAIKFYEEALVIAREIGERREEEGRLGNLGRAYRALGRVEQAIKFLEEALAIAREIGDRRGEGIWLDNLGNAYHDLGQVKQAIEFYKKALTIARETGDRRGESYRLLGLGKALLATGELSKARRRCVEALALEVPTTNYLAALALGTVLLHQHDPTAGETFADAAARCRAMLDKTAGLYEPRYALAAALVGSAVCDPRWVEEGEQAGLLAPALAEYRRALETCAAPGVVRDALRDLEMIRAAGIEDLKPVFELLQGKA